MEFVCVLEAGVSYYGLHSYFDSPQVWMSGRVANQSSVKELFDGYISRGISVGGLNIDSTWSVCPGEKFLHYVMHLLTGYQVL